MAKKAEKENKAGKEEKEKASHKAEKEHKAEKGEKKEEHKAEKEKAEHKAEGKVSPGFLPKGKKAEHEKAHEKPAHEEAKKEHEKAHEEHKEHEKAHEKEEHKEHEAHKKHAEEKEKEEHKKGHGEAPEKEKPSHEHIEREVEAHGEDDEERHRRRERQKKDRKRAVFSDLKPAEIVEIIVKLANEGKSASEIGMILRDQHGVLKAEKALGKKIGAVLGEKEMLPKIPEDMMSLIRKSVTLGEHLAKNKKDMSAKRGLMLTVSKIRALEQYYKRKGKLPLHWRYSAETAALLAK